jgi:hypothetical protein
VAEPVRTPDDLNETQLTNNTDDRKAQAESGKETQNE